MMLDENDISGTTTTAADSCHDYYTIPEGKKKTISRES